MPGLYAVGEVAATGVHGANRLASNSLTEAIATGRRLGRLLGRQRPERQPGALRSPDAGPAGPGGLGVPAAARPELAAAMSQHAGVLRDAAGLRHLLDVLAAVPPAGSLDLPTVEATNLHTVCALVALAALARPESRGCHRRADAPRQLPGRPRHTTVRSRDGRLDLRELSPAGAQHA